MDSESERPESRPAAVKRTETRRLDDRRAGAGSARVLSLALGATGVVFGDIGTSPLYTFNSIFTEIHELPRPDDVRDAFGLIFWTMTWITCFKYLGLVMRISHHGEGGTLALMQVLLERCHPKASDDETSGSDSNSSDGGLVAKGSSGQSCKSSWIILLGMLSCSMLIGDGVITPPNSVLGALNSPVVEISVNWNLVLAVAILIFTFALQRLGSRIIGLVAGPFMVLWFLTIGAFGLYQILQDPDRARIAAEGFNPKSLWTWFATGNFRGWKAFKSLAGAVLCVTGAEALYADMGHFGTVPITLAWFVLVYPCLVLQYWGQAVVIMKNPSLVAENPLYATVPASLQWPVFILAALAAIIASQALISGVFSILSSAHALEFVPRIMVLHTNPNEKGQVYIPSANWMLMTACILVTVAFKTSDNLVAAYGIAVTGAFIFTTLMLWYVLRDVWKVWLPCAVLIILPMLFVDLMFWAANLLKMFDSGWVPIVLAGSCLLVMDTHFWGRKQELALFEREAEVELRRLGSLQVPEQAPGGWNCVVCTTDGLFAMLRHGGISRAQTAGIFLSPAEGYVPQSVCMIAGSTASLPRTIVLLHVKFVDAPFVDDGGRYVFEALDVDLGVYSIVLKFGYAEPLTATRFDVHATVGRIAKANADVYPALACMVPQQDLVRSFTYEGNLTSAVLEQDGDQDDQSEDIEEPGLFVPRPTYFVTRRLFVPSSTRACLSRLRVRLFSSIVKYGCTSFSFLGLEGQAAVELARVVHL